MSQRVIILGRVSSSLKAGIPSHVRSIINSFDNDKEISFINVVPSINKQLNSSIRLTRLTKKSYEIECKSFFVRKTLGISLIYLYVILKVLRKHKESKLNLHLPDPISILYVILFTRKRKIIATYHADLLNKGIFSFLYKIILNLLIAKKCFFLFPTEKHISSTYLSKKNINGKVIPFIFKKPNFSDKELEIIKNKFKANDTKVLFVGRHVPYKGIDVLIKAFKKIDKNVNVSLNIAGEGPLSNNLQNLAKNDERINFLGEINDEELKLYYCISHIFVLPSVTKAEAFGIVQVEAMLHSCFCLSSYLNNGVNIVNKENISGKSFKPYDYKKLKELITFFSENKIQRNKFMQNAKEYSFETFASESLINNYKAVYKR